MVVNYAHMTLLFRSMLATPPPDSAHPLAVALSSNQPRLGYFYLNYLSRHTADGNLEPYSMFAEIFEDLSLRECLVKDLKVSCATNFCVVTGYAVHVITEGDTNMYLCVCITFLGIEWLHAILPYTLPLHNIVMQTFFFSFSFPSPSLTLSLSPACLSLVVYV